MMWSQAYIEFSWIFHNEQRKNKKNHIAQYLRTGQELRIYVLTHRKNPYYFSFKLDILLGYWTEKNTDKYNRDTVAPFVK